jgi:TfoX/Sxy family transcriptional regulator of competence genes
VTREPDAPRQHASDADQGGKFGDSTLKVDAKIFALISKGKLVVKLPRQRVDELVASGTGRPYDSGHGRIMKKWVTIAPQHTRRWASLADEARRFVAALLGEATASLTLRGTQYGGSWRHCVYCSVVVCWKGDSAARRAPVSSPRVVGLTIGVGRRRLGGQKRHDLPILSAVSSY